MVETVLALLNPENVRKYIDWADEFNKPPDSPDASVLIVAYNTNWDLIDCLESLKSQSFTNFETLLLDNGENEKVLDELRGYQLRYFRLKENYRPSLARNIGIAHARGEVVCFLDDDAIAHPDFVKNHVQANQIVGVLGVRGKVLPKTNNIYNYLTQVNDLGEEVIPSYIDLEGNASFARETLLTVGGFTPQVFAGEGAELSYRIFKYYGEANGLVYWPGAIIYHDYSNNWRKYIKKTLRGARTQSYLESLYPDFWEFIESYHPFPIAKLQKPRLFHERLGLAIIRRAGRLTRTVGLAWYRRRASLEGYTFE